MADGHELAIATYLTVDGQVFLAPQYNVAFDPTFNEGGSCPDFVALDLKHREVVVVEVSYAANWKPVAERAKQRQGRWYRPIGRKLRELGIIDDSWNGPRFLGFVRRANVEAANASFASEADVIFCAIEDATFPWLYWDERVKNGLPRKKA
jgi:hypothetical protein